MNAVERLFMCCAECFVILFTLKVCVCARVVHEPREKERGDGGLCVRAGVCVCL